MSELTRSERDRLRSQIEQEIEEIAQTARAAAEDTRPVELDQQSVGRLSRMDSLQQQAMSKAQAARRQQRRRLLEITLKRINSEDYGACAECGDPIGMQRLTFNPALTRCRICMSE